jgi:4-hydroxy-3-methylbut-2-enyl diphosphate reductase IspH
MLGCSNPAFCVIGTRDPGYTKTVVDDLTASGITVAVIDGAAAPVEVVQQAIQKLEEWKEATD